ncbi:MAG: hypothetical protein JW804_00130 [Sedimentisphaerales bacterium]|nr:hypothetical protein [Sedimentisphaerales bacterium]
MNNKDENLKELFGKFYDAAGAESAAEDVAQGEKLFVDNPAPQPDAQLLETIKARIYQKLEQRTPHRTIKVYLKAMAAAAAVIVIALLVFQNPPEQSQNGKIITAGFTIPWESSDLEDDTNLSLLAAQVQELEDEVITLKLSENGSDTYNVDELESELLAINDDFWKG